MFQAYKKYIIRSKIGRIFESVLCGFIESFKSGWVPVRGTAANLLKKPYKTDLNIYTDFRTNYIL